MTRTANMVPASRENIERAAKILQGGGLVAFPTETVYGLGGDATNDKAIAGIFEVKKRPEFNPLIVHVHSLHEAEKMSDFSASARQLAQVFWPGPLTLVLKRRNDCPVSRLASAGLDTLAVRMPSHEVAQGLLQASGLPIAAPSANPSGFLSPTTAHHVADALGDAVDLILDGGPCRVGLESTIVNMTSDPPTVLRPGALAEEDLEDYLGPLIHSEESDRPTAPGMLKSHYAPRTPLRLNHDKPVEPKMSGANEAWLGFGPDDEDATMNLSPGGDLREAAANLFSMLHDLDQGGYAAIVVSPIPEIGLGVAINDRLRRAAAAS